MKHTSARLMKNLAPNTGTFNMAADQVLAMGINDSGYDFIFRIYRFNPPAVSLGRNQSDSEVNATECAKKGWELVRRPTGGRSLLHLDDICYSVIIPRREDVLKELRTLYEGVAIALAKALVSLGINASPSESVNMLPFDRGIKKSRLCIGARVRGEVHIGGRKITSASQRIYKDSILQHGSIFYDGNPTVAAEIVSDDLLEGDDIFQKLKERIITMEEASNKLVSMEVFSDRFIEHFSKHFSVKLTELPLDPAELELISASENYFSLSQIKQNISAA